MAGYSKTPLTKKLGIKPGMDVWIVDGPDDYHETLGALPEAAVLYRTTVGALIAGQGEASERGSDRQVDGRDKDGRLYLQWFVRDAAALDRLPDIKAALAPSGMLWVSWPKQSSGVDTDVNGNVVRERALAAGFVDIKVCAVDATWSGLKLVIPVKSRP